jgi:hypothetical protein
MERHRVTLELRNINETTATQDAHIAHAKGAARRHRVSGGDQTPLHEDSHRDPRRHGHNGGRIVWHVFGDRQNVQDMCDRWTGRPDVDENGNQLPGFDPTVRLISIDRE